MAHSNREKQSEERKQHKVALKQERAEKVQKKTVWDLLKDDRAGVIQPKDGEEDDGKKKFRVRTRKVKAENRLSHHRGHGNPSNKVCVVTHDGEVLYIKIADAALRVKAGSAKYTTKTAWRKYMSDQRDA